MRRFLVPDYVYKARDIQVERYHKPVTKEDVEFLEQMFYERPRFYPDDLKQNIPRFEYVVRASYAYMHEIAAKLRYQDTEKIIAAGDANYDWKYLAEPIQNITDPVIICAGAGINISFEIALAEKFPNAKALILDPSPQSVKHFENVQLPKNLRFVPVGLAGSDSVLKFFRPTLPGVGSLSTLQLNPGNDYFELPVKCVRTLLEELSASPEQLALLKFDIEGAEHEVIDNIISENILPRQVAFEFDQPIPPWTIESTLNKLLAVGYEVCSIWELNVLLERK
ncbi:MAG: FkbM family methyltransferase [Henriciella sp.]